MSNSATVNNNIGYVGYYSGSTGTATVAGVGSEWINSGNLYVGYGGRGMLSISSGGEVGNADGYIANNSSAPGAVTVDGTGSNWTNAGKLYVGYSGSGTLAITNGGAVSNTYAYLGYASGSTGTAIVDGAGSIWTNRSYLYVGNSGGGTLSISGGGIVNNGYAYVGYSSGSTASVLISGTGSTWANKGNLYVGYGGSGTLTQAAGNNSVAGILCLGCNATGNGAYNLNGGVLALHGLAGGSGAATFNFGGGSLQASGDFSSSLPMTVTGIGGNATVNTNGHAVTLSRTLTGTGGLTKSGAGTLTLLAANNYNGTTTVAGGTLELQTVAARHPVFDLGGADIQAGRIVFDYAGAADPVTTIQSLLRASYDGGRWDVGQFRDSTAATTGLTLGCFDDTSSGQVTVMATYPGDFNLDGVVDSLDRSIWFANAFTGTTWQQGDANYDGVVDGLDRDLMLCALGLPSVAGMSAAAGVTAVPEPGTLALLAAGLLSLLTFAWRKRR